MDRTSTYNSLYSRTKWSKWKKKSRFIMKMTRCMLHEKNLPKKF